MEQYIVTGMSCAACQARVEKAVSKVPGVESCSVSLLTNSMGVEGTASSSDIIKAVVDAGYGASLKEPAGAGRALDKRTDYSAEAEALKDHETPVLKKRLIASLGFLIVLMYFSMGHMMLGLPLPAFFDGNHVAMGIVQMLLAGIVMVINQKFFVNGFRGLIHRSPNMDTLVAMGSMASFCWSVYALLAMTGAQVSGDSEGVMKYMNEFYFESAAMILTLITVGKMLEARSKGKTTDALRALMDLSPKTALIQRDGRETEVPVEEVEVGDVFLVRPGENIPVDGLVLEGETAVNESALTGESIPVDKAPGDRVSAATINSSGFIKCRATRVGEDTTLAQIIKMVSNAAATKAPIAKIADKVSGVFVPTVIGIAVLTTLIWLLVGRDAGFALARGISVLVISCPCALGLATPVAIMVGNGVGARNGILFKTAVSLEETGKADIVCLDKTGTITKGEPVVTDILPADSVSAEELLRTAYSLEMKSEHPLAKAVVARAEETGLEGFDIEEFKAVSGKGLKGSDSGSGREMVGGNMGFVSEYAQVPEEFAGKTEEMAGQGKTCLFFARGDRFLGMIAVADVIKEESPEAIEELRNMGIRVVMLTGDNRGTAEAIGREAGVDGVIAQVLPDGKEQVIRELSEEGKVIMVGDGINDAPALTRADMGMAIGAGTDVAIEAADVVLMDSRLTDVPAAVRLSRAVLRNIHQNLFWAFFYNVIGIPLAAGAFIGITGWTMNPMFGAAAMSLSSFFVVTNALRLNLLDVHDPSRDRKRVTKAIAAEDMQTKETTTGSSVKEENTMEKKMIIEGMMCPHCEATVKKALEAVDGVESAEVSHENNCALVKLSKEVPDDVLKKAVEDKEYEVKEIA